MAASLTNSYEPAGSNQQQSNLEALSAALLARAGANQPQTRRAMLQAQLPNLAAELKRSEAFKFGQTRESTRPYDVGSEIASAEARKAGLASADYGIQQMIAEARARQAAQSLEGITRGIDEYGRNIWDILPKYASYSSATAPKSWDGTELPVNVNVGGQWTAMPAGRLEQYNQYVTNAGAQLRDTQTRSQQAALASAVAQAQAALNSRILAGKAANLEAISNAYKSDWLLPEDVSKLQAALGV